MNQNQESNLGEIFGTLVDTMQEVKTTLDNINRGGVLYPQSLENCTEAVQMPLMEGDSTMAKHRIRVCVGYNDDGTAVVKQVSGSNDIELADRIARAILDSERRGEFISMGEEPPKMTCPRFKEYAEEWFATYKADRVKPTTAGGYRSIFESHFFPAFGEIPIDQLQTKDIQEFLNVRKEYSKKYLEDMLILLRTILKSALRDGFIASNPADDDRLVIPSTKKETRNALSVDDVKDIIHNLYKLQDQDRRYIALMVFTGLRRGEIIGLQWSDIDIADSCIHVRQNATFSRGHNQAVIGTTKSENGIRDVYFESAFLEFLQPLGVSGYVIGGSKPISLTMHNRTMQRINKTIDLHGATPHTLRHTYATMLYDIGASLKTIQSTIGHADMKTTADRYVHPREEKKREASAKVWQLLAG